MEKVKGKRGVVYLGRIPPHMKEHKVRYILSSFGPVKRIYLQKEPVWKYKKRLEKGGRKGRLYTDGWVEFEMKVHAKHAAQQMNGQTAGLKGRWSDDIWVVRYLHGYKWEDLMRELEEERVKNSKQIQDETQKVRSDAKQWLKQTKATMTKRRIRPQEPVTEEAPAAE